jgi:HlyD family secretion protein
VATDQITQTERLPLVDNGTGTQTMPSPRSRLRLVPLVMVSLFTGAVIGLYFQPPALKTFFGITGLEPGGGTSTPIAIAIQQVQTQKEVAVFSEGDIVALGRVMPRGDVISIAPPFGAGDARIETINVTVGDQVARGDTLAVLDNKSQLQNLVETARATVVIREANLLQTRQSISASLAEAQAAVKRAQATAAEAQSELTSLTTLLERGVTTRATFDQAVARATEAARDVERNLATLSRYDRISGTVQVDIAVAKANLVAAQVDIKRATSNLSQATVLAPIDGTILKINSHVGERPASEGVLNMGDISQMVVEAEVYQTLIGRVSIGDPVRITADALTNSLTGKVYAIGLEIGRQSITSNDPADNTDARVVDVIVWLDAASSLQAARFTNLETIVRINVGKGP